MPTDEIPALEAVTLRDIGPYAEDKRLVQRGERYASFYGHRCNPSVTVTAIHDGFQASQYRSEYRGGVAISLMPTVVATGSTAAEALAEIIGPVQA